MRCRPMQIDNAIIQKIRCLNRAVARIVAGIECKKCGYPQDEDSDAEQRNAFCMR